MKAAYLNGKMIDLSSTKRQVSEIRSEVQFYGATCAACGRSVIFRSGPIKGPHFAHKERSDDCQYYHPSTNNGDHPLYMAEAIQLFVSVLQRPLKAKEKEQIYLWFHIDEYRLSEMDGALKELISEGTSDQLFKRMDSKLYAITRSKKNPYFKR